MRATYYAAVAIFSAGCSLFSQVANTSTEGIRGASAAAPEDSAPPANAPPASELLATPPAGIPQGAQAGEIIARRLDGFQTLSIDGKRGQCYTVRIALEKDAALSSHARRILELTYRTRDREISITPRMLGHDIRPTQRAWDAKVGCPQRDAPIEFDLQATSMSEVNPGHLHDLGAGTIQFQIYTWNISSAQLQDNAAATRRSILETEQSKQQFTNQTCSECRRRKDECLDKKARGLTNENCVSVFDSCVFTSGLRQGACTY